MDCHAGVCVMWVSEDGNRKLDWHLAGCVGLLQRQTYLAELANGLLVAGCSDSQRSFSETFTARPKAFETQEGLGVASRVLRLTLRHMTEHPTNR